MHRYDAACKHLSANAMMADQYQHLLLHAPSMTMLQRRKGRWVDRTLFIMPSLATFALNFLLLPFDYKQMLVHLQAMKPMVRR